MHRPGSSLSRIKQSHQSLQVNTVNKQKEKKIPTKEELIKQRDFVNAIALLEYEKLMNKDNTQNQLWLAYCYFHNGDYDKALDIYSDLTKKNNYDLSIHTYKACCLYALCKYKEAFDEAKKGTSTELNTRVKFHCSFKLSLTNEVIDQHSKLNKNSVQDQLCLAALQFLKNEHEDAIEIYKKVYMDKKYDAVNIYLAMCYYKLEYFDIALDLVNHYLTTHKDSVIANNLKAAIEYHSTGNEKVAQSYLLALQEYCKSNTGNIIEDNDLLRHNMAVFDNDETSNNNKLKIFNNLIDIIPESKLNLIIYYLRNDQVNQAYSLIKDLNPNNTKEYILKAVVHCLLGQQGGDKNSEHIKKAQNYFQCIGASAAECDTIEGRQCMASCFRLNGIFNDEIIYLESIESYMRDDDDFNWNYGIALAACQKYKEAEEVLLRVKKEKYKNDQIYLSWLCRCYISNGRPDYAWNLYISIENHLTAVYILGFIAHDFYRMGHFYFSFKAFLFLEKFAPSNENASGKISSAIGVFYQLISGKIGSERLQEIIHYLGEGGQTEEVKKAIKVFKKWGKEYGYNFSEQGGDYSEY